MLLKRQATQDRQTDRQTDKFGSVTVLTNLWTYPIDNLDVRLNNEAFLINLVASCGNILINDYIPPLKSYLSIHN